MRIVSGKYRGKKLFSPDEGSVIRPTTDRVKEAVFNILFDGINENTVFADVFCGSGALGIEALSRGVKKVYFIDNGAESAKLLKKNLTGIQGNYEIIQKDYKSALASLPEPADVIYCDPPYMDGIGAEILLAIYGADCLAEGGTVIIERAKTLSSPVHAAYSMYDSRKYALTAVDFFRRIRTAAVTGTFDPFTNGHLYLVDKALEKFDCVHIVILKNPDKISYFDTEKKKEIIAKSVGDRNGIIIASYDGFTADYCKINGIKYIIRGVRNAADMAYELAMADYNKKHGNADTLIFPAERPEISSGAVKAFAREDKDIGGLVSPQAEELIKEY